MKLSSRNFWDCYRETLRTSGTRSAYASDPGWTPIAKEAAEKVCKEMDLGLQREYLRLDVMGFEYRGKNDCFDWDLRVAFEHENCSQAGKDWCDELCKLTHVVADLRVLVGYFNHHRDKSLTETLQARVRLMGERMRRVPDSSWLFIFGPSMPQAREEFQAFTLSDELILEPLHDAIPLVPLDFPAG